MNKTPIMVLQELGMKQCILPSYDIISSQNGTHQNIFTFKVKYNNLFAEGTAPNKKEAKQNAAQNMLKLLQETQNISPKELKNLELLNNNIITPKSQSSSPTAASPNFANFIGILQEYCTKNSLINPTYEVCEMSGPAHSMKFKVSCILGSITEKAEASTIKLAKQLAAHKMLKNLPNVKNITNISEGQLPTNDNHQIETNESIFKDLGMQISNLKIVDSTVLNTVKQKYLIATCGNNLQALHLEENIAMESYHLYFKSMIYNNICNSQEEALNVLYNTFKTHINKCRTVENYDKSNLLIYKQVLTFIKKKCNLSIKKVSLPSSTNMAIIGFKVNLLVPIIQLDMNANPVYAEQRALLKIIKAIMLYLK